MTEGKDSVDQEGSESDNQASGGDARSSQTLPEWSRLLLVIALIAVALRMTSAGQTWIAIANVAVAVLFIAGLAADRHSGRETDLTGTG